jgi:hypothetical protein
VTSIPDPGRRAVLAAMLAAAALGTACAPSNPNLQTGPDAEITHDGLHRLDNTSMDAAWMKPDIDLGAYTGLMLAGAGIALKPVDDNGQRWWPGKSGQSEFPISEEGQKRLQQEMRTAFLEELSKLERYELVNEPGAGVLLLVGGLIDVVSKVPPVDECAGRCEVYLTEIGEATLVLELRDSVTQEVLVRAIDRRLAESPGWAIEADSVTVWSEVRRLARSWARLMRERLEEFDSVPDTAG